MMKGLKEWLYINVITKPITPFAGIIILYLFDYLSFGKIPYVISCGAYLIIGVICGISTWTVLNGNKLFRGVLCVVYLLAVVIGAGGMLKEISQAPSVFNVASKQNVEANRNGNEMVRINSQGIGSLRATTRKSICTSCGGSGVGTSKCTYCNGSGVDPTYESTKGKIIHGFAEKDCAKCGGSGRAKCTVCGGKGEY